MRQQISSTFVLLSVMVSSLLLTPTTCSAERLLVVPGGTTYLGDVDPHDPKNFRTCEGKIIPIEKAEVRDTDKKCRGPEKLLVRSDGNTFLGALNPQDPTKFMTCEGKIIPIEKAEVRDTDKKCRVLEKLLVRSDGSTFLGALDPQDPTKFTTCEGKTIAVDKAELKETDQRCHFQAGGGGGVNDCFFFNLQRQSKPHAVPDPRKELEEWCAKLGNFHSPCCAKLSEMRMRDVP